MVICLRVVAEVVAFPFVRLPSFLPPHPWAPPSFRP